MVTEPAPAKDLSSPEPTSGPQGEGLPGGPAHRPLLLSEGMSFCLSFMDILSFKQVTLLCEETLVPKTFIN